MRHAHWFFSPLCALLLAPLLLGLINRTKAFVAGRRGPPLVQPYRDVVKCLRRGAGFGGVWGRVVPPGPGGEHGALLSAPTITAVVRVGAGGALFPLPWLLS